MKIFIATDHTGLTLKEKIKTFLTEKGHEVVDCGAFEYDKDDDYPDFISKAAKEVSQDSENTKGIVLGGSGQGEAMTANKFKGVRCALFYTPAIPVTEADINGRMSENPFEIVKLSRIHNDANMLSLSSRFLKQEDMLKAVDVFIQTPFDKEDRHMRRINKIKQLEQNA